MIFPPPVDGTVAAIMGLLGVFDVVVDVSDVVVVDVVTATCWPCTFPKPSARDKDKHTHHFPVSTGARWQC